MTKHIVALTAAVTLLIVGCGCSGGPQHASENGSTESTLAENGPIDLRLDKTAGPDINLKEGPEWTIWAQINAADPHGISVDKVEDGDELTIETLSGIAYFTGKSGWWRVLSAIYKVAGAFVSMTSTADKVITAVKDETLPIDDETDKINQASKPRDAYGRKLDEGGEFAEKEGGIVVCMPNAAGPMYAHSANYFIKKEKKTSGNQKGRSDRRCMKKKSEMPNNCFPATRDKKVHTIIGNGVLHIYAFDHNYRDNAGIYEIKFRIKRPGKDG